MKTQTLTILGVVVLIIGGAGYALSQQGERDTIEFETMMEKDTGAVTEDVTASADSMEKEDTMMKDDGMTKDDMADDTVVMKGNYETYSAEKLARADTGKVILFFHASWCPTCRAHDSEIMKNLESIPGGVHILKLNFDTETELRKKYGVTVQHTLVQVNSSGDQITKWSGGNTLASVLSRTQ